MAGVFRARRWLVRDRDAPGLWDDVVSVEVAEGGAWRTVFTARWHPEVAGQEVASRLSPAHPLSENPRYKGQYRVETRRVGHQPAWWEVLGYIPGVWEEELNRLWETAKEVRLEGEKGRFGL